MRNVLKFRVINVLKKVQKNDMRVIKKDKWNDKEHAPRINRKRKSDDTFTS